MVRYVIIVAGGKGLRMGTELPKQFLPFNGKPVLMHTLEAFYSWDPECKLILVLPVDHQPYWKMLCRELKCNIPHQIANGGDTRFHSVRNGLEYVIEPGLVGVHDGVRPFVFRQVITNCFEEAFRFGGVIPVISLVDSIRQKDEQGSHPVDRLQYEAVQTPQVFRTEWLHEAYKEPFSPLFTDDASVVENKGYPVRTVPGNRENIKITDPFDLIVAEALFNRKE